MKTNMPQCAEILAVKTSEITNHTFTALWISLSVFSLDHGNNIACQKNEKYDAAFVQYIIIGVVFDGEHMTETLVICFQSELNEDVTNTLIFIILMFSSSSNKRLCVSGSSCYYEPLMTLYYEWNTMLLELLKTLKPRK